MPRRVPEAAWGLTARPPRPRRKRQALAYAGLVFVGFGVSAHHLWVMSQHVSGVGPIERRAVNDWRSSHEWRSADEWRAKNAWPSHSADANSGSDLGVPARLGGLGAAAHLQWTRRYARLSQEPLGFGGYMETPPSPPKRSLLESYLLRQTESARTRRERRRFISYTAADPTARPSVCVVLTNYNNALFINATIVDTLTQSFQGDYMVVVADDYSTDGSRSHIRAWAREQERLVPVLLPGRSMGGTGIPSNIGLDICQNHDPPFTYVAFVDGDDVLEPDFLEQMVATGERTGAEVIISDFDLWDRGKVSAVKAKSEMEAWSQLPKGTPIAPTEHFSYLAMLMPAPWRKMLRLDYVVKHDIRFPEGDFFYEDNVLHWLILLTAAKIVLYPNVLVHHRTSRSLFGTHEIRNAGFFAVMNAIGDAVMERELYGEHAEAVAKEFVAFTGRLRWIIRRQSGDKMRSKFDSCFTRFEAFWYPKLQRMANVTLPSSSDMATAYYASGTNASQNASLAFAPYTPLELSVVVPVYNAAPFLLGLVERIDQISADCDYEAFYIDGASTDGSDGILSNLSATRPRMYDVHLSYTAPAGSLRNLVIPLLEGLYVFFLDSDDFVDAVALEAATVAAMREDLDVLMLPYQLVFITQEGEKEVTSLMGMDKYDQTTWEQVTALAVTQETREAAMTLVNYPWNRLTRTRLLHDADGIFFGTTQVQNDVQYHWHTLSVARRVAFLSASSTPICFHKKFVGTQRMQLTKVKSHRRLEMFWALQATHRVLCTEDDPFTNDPDTMAAWGAFVQKTLVWARNTKLVPAKSMPAFLHSQAEMLRCATSCSMSCLYSQWTFRNATADPSNATAGPSPPPAPMPIDDGGTQFSSEGV